MKVIERILYFGKPGLAEAVLRQRREATRVRLTLGLPEGSIAWRPQGEGGPDVVWSCVFEDAEAQRRDLAVRDDSAEFAAVRTGMDALLADSARLVERFADDGMPYESEKGWKS